MHSLCLVSLREKLILLIPDRNLVTYVPCYATHAVLNHIATPGREDVLRGVIVLEHMDAQSLHKRRTRRIQQEEQQLLDDDAALAEEIRRTNEAEEEIDPEELADLIQKKDNSSSQSQHG